MRIQLLDESTSNRIAAGEVVERPASVVKELVENALDAGAGSISVEIVSGGLSLIRIVDNGSGIHPDDLPLAFMRHATGKIRSGDSLMGIETMGFRGEALSSIAAVSRVTLSSRQKGAELGSSISLEGGKVKDQGPAGCPEGTSITVQDLFFNTPARLKFVKSASVEAARVSDVILRTILAHPEVSIRFVNNHKMIYHSPGSGLKDAILSVYGTQIANQLLPVEMEKDSISVNGYIGTQELSRQSHAGQTLIVNGRVIQSKLLSEAVQKGYGQSLMIGRFPFFVLNIGLPFASVDVNVHPQKTEVRFADPLAIGQCITEAVSRAVSAKQPAQTKAFAYQPPQPQAENSPGEPPIKTPEQVEFSAPKPEPLPQEETIDYTKQTLQQSDRLHTDSVSFRLSSQQDVFREDAGVWAPKLGNAKKQEQQAAPEKLPLQAERHSLGQAPLVLGQLFETYLLVQSQNDFYILDQHAGHERLTYDAYKQQILQSEIASQPLLVPDILQLTFAEMEAFSDHQETFSQLGFDVAAFGEREVIVRAYPLVLGKVALAQFFTDVLDHIFNGQNVKMTDMIMDKLIRSACRHSIKAGDALEAKEMESLVAMLQNNDQLTCPHGRPIAIKISKTELEKRFGRLV